MKLNSELTGNCLCNLHLWNKTACPLHVPNRHYYQRLLRNTTCKFVDFDNKVPIQIAVESLCSLVLVGEFMPVAAASHTVWTLTHPDGQTEQYQHTEEPAET